MYTEDNIGPIRKTVLEIGFSFYALFGGYRNIDINYPFRWNLENKYATKLSDTF